MENDTAYALADERFNSCNRLREILVGVNGLVVVVVLFRGIDLRPFCVVTVDIVLERIRNLCDYAKESL